MKSDSVKPSSIAIIANNLEIANGADRTAAHAIHAVNQMGYIPDVYSFVPGTSENIEKNYNLKVEFNYLSLWGRKVFPSYRAFLKNIQFLRKEYPILMDFAGFLNYQDKSGWLYYVHFPEYALSQYHEKYKSLLGKLYFFPRSLFLDPIQKRNYQKFQHTQFFCNSYFTQGIIEKTSGRKVEVLYPPVSVPENSSLNQKERNNSVITLGRFGVEKKQLEQLEIAKTLPELNFHFCGSGNEDDSYLQSIRNKILADNIQNVSIHLNPEWKFIESLFEDSSFFLHSMRDEHFGISTVEAIFRGCVPIVHNSGGQKEIAIFPELRYSNPGDGSIKLKYLWENPACFKLMLASLSQNCKKFQAIHFENTIKDFITQQKIESPLP